MSGGREPDTLPDRSPPLRPGRGRRPAELVRDGILSAAAKLLLAEGMAGFTVEKVAESAGTSRTTIHKWWPSRGALALDGYFAMVDERMKFRDTGDIAVDLDAHLRKFARHLRDSSAARVIVELIGQAQSDPHLFGELQSRYFLPRIAIVTAVLETARQRGQIKADVDVGAVVDQLWGACYFRILTTRDALTDRYVSDLVANLVRGILA